VGTDVPRRRKKGPLPFGYSETSDGYLKEVSTELEALDKIKDLVNDGSISLRDGASWVAHKTGRPISHQGLKNVIRERYNT
tara:strand:+ start:1068 stop:1310 length:243 start_codon:yes stop_codon:yes gene_type:complete